MLGGPMGWKGHDPGLLNHGQAKAAVLSKADGALPPPNSKEHFPLMSLPKSCLKEVSCGRIMNVARLRLYTRHPLQKFAATVE